MQCFGWWAARGVKTLSVLQESGASTCLYNRNRTGTPVIGWRQRPIPIKHPPMRKVGTRPNAILLGSASRFIGPHQASSGLLALCFARQGHYHRLNSGSRRGRLRNQQVRSRGRILHCVNRKERKKSRTQPIFRTSPVCSPRMKRNAGHFFVAVRASTHRTRPGNRPQC